jgi:hypothetical protein
MDFPNIVSSRFKLLMRGGYMTNEIQKLVMEEFEFNSNLYRQCEPRYMTNAEIEWNERYEEENKLILRKVRYEKNIEYYKQMYIKIVDICEKIADNIYARLLNIIDRYSEHFGRDAVTSASKIIEEYIDEQIKSNYEDTSTYISGSEWKYRVIRFVNPLLDIHSSIFYSARFIIFKRKTEFSYSQVEAVLVYLKEKCNIEIELCYIDGVPYKKDTLLAMQTINKFSSENNISNNDTLELFCEYIGPPLFRDSDYDD